MNHAQKQAERKKKKKMKKVTVRKIMPGNGRPILMSISLLLCLCSLCANPFIFSLFVFIYHSLCGNIGTGTFGRVYLTKFRQNQTFYAMKVLKKSEVVRLKQVEHINSEKQILAQVHYPFIVNL